MRAYVIAFNLFVAIFITGCTSAPSPDISEVSFRSGGGQLSYWYQIVVRKDGTAEYLGDVSPERRRGPKSFDDVPGEGAKRVMYRGRISPEQFNELAKVIIKNDFFSLKDNYGGVADAVQTTTSVVYCGGRKEVSNQIGQGGEKLTEIERAIEQVADHIAWARAG
ncbi:MAG: hypothetical protein QOJ64_4273 [Acidobacteriota bacterium]|jgi:hypothetical protein|nr:hypothetical protein [Acidobacteriota bacterium]